MKIVIPKPDSPFRISIKKGSGIVMLTRDEGAVIYYEGNLYSAENLYDYDQRIKCAAGRATVKYPTVALASVPRELLNHFIHVGWCYPKDNYRIELMPGAKEVIEEWTKK